MPSWRGVLVSTGIYRNATTYIVVVPTGVKQRQKEHYYDLAEDVLFLQAERRRLIGWYADQLRTDRQAAVTVLTVARAFDAWIATLPTEVVDGRVVPSNKRRDARTNAAAWGAAFPDQPLEELTSTAILEQLHAWRQAGAALSTWNNRRWHLQAVFRHAFGPNGYDPISRKQVPRQDPGDGNPRDIPWDVVQQIFTAIPNRGPWGPNVSKIRLRIQAATGFIPSMLARTQRHDVIIKSDTVGSVFMRRRPKGKGAHERTLKLHPEAIKAFRDLDAVNGWGPFDAQAVSRVFARAIAKVAAAHREATGKPLPLDPPRVDSLGRETGTRPYDLRHSFGTQAYLESGDQAAVGELMGHARGSKMTARYTKRGITATSRKAIDGIAHLVLEVPTPDAPAKILPLRRRTATKGGRVRAVTPTPARQAVRSR